MKILLCGRGKCCPTVEKIDDAVVIEFDDQPTVKFTLENWEVLRKKMLSGEL